MPKFSELPVVTAVTDATAKIPVLEGGATSAITAANLAADSTFATVYAALVHAARHKSGGADAIKLDELAAPTDVTTLNASTSAHGLLPKLNNVSTQYLSGTGVWSTPAGGGGGTGEASIFDVKDYGAVGNGSTNDTAAINSAADAACTAGGTLLFSGPATYIVQGTGSFAIIDLLGPCKVVIEAGATIKVSSATGLYGSVFGPTSQATDYTGLTFEGPGTIDGNCVARGLPTGVTGSSTAACSGISWFTKGSNIKVRNIRFTRFDSVWCITLFAGAVGEMRNVEVSGCQFDTFGAPIAANGHDHSSIYIDAVGMHVHHNTWWQGAPSNFTFTTNYGARTAIELHGSDQNCHHNEVHAMQFFGNACASNFSYGTAGQSVGINWHDNKMLHVGVAVDIYPYVAGSGLIPTTTTAGLTSGNTYTTISVAALPGAYPAGLVLRLMSGASVQLVTMAAAAATGATSITVLSFVANATYASGIVVTPLWGLKSVDIHDNVFTIDSAIWNDASLQVFEIAGIRYQDGQSSGTVEGVRIANNHGSLVVRNMSAVSYTSADPGMVSIIQVNGAETNRTILRDWKITGNTFDGSIGSSISLSLYAVDGLEISNNICRDPRLAYSYGFGIYLTALLDATNGYLRNVLIAGNTIIDDNAPSTTQGGSNRWGYTAYRTGTTLLYINSSIKENVRVLDNVVNCADGTVIAVCENTGDPVYLRATQIAATWNAPPGNYKQGSTVLLLQPRGGSAPTTPHREQTAAGSGSTWTGT